MKKNIFFILFFVVSFAFSQDPWNASTVYTAGDQVTHQSKLFEALWWTQNQEPNPNYQYGPWVEVQVTPDGVYPIWTFSGRFDKDDYVVFNQNLYRAKWQTRGNNPESGGPWEFISSYSYEEDVIVPVSLVQFEVKKEGNFIVASWKTASEKDNLYYELQSSTDGSTFETVATVLPVEPSDDGYRCYYESLYDSYVEKIIFFRLKQTDVDGLFEFFDSVALIKQQNSPEVTFPNPSREGESFFILTDFEIKIFDSLGRLVKVSSHQKNILPKGEYFIVSGNKTVRHIVR